MVNTVLLVMVILNAIYTLYWVSLVKAHTWSASFVFKLVPIILAIGALLYAVKVLNII